MYIHVYECIYIYVHTCIYIAPGTARRPQGEAPPGTRAACPTICLYLYLYLSIYLCIYIKYTYIHIYTQHLKPCAARK